MRYSAVILNATSLAVVMVCTACSGGNGTNVGNTPTPPSTPTPASLAAPLVVTPKTLSPSTTFTKTMQSGGFVTIVSSGGTITDTGKTSSSVNANDPTNFISYDATQNVYTLNATDAKGQPVITSFNPKNASSPPAVNGSVDPTEVNYFKGNCFTSGCYDQGPVVVTHTGNSAFVYSYTALEYSVSVGSAIVGDHQDRSYQTAVFGMATATSAVPRTGSASYVLDLIMNNYASQAGTGVVNFGAGTYNFSVAINDGDGAAYAPKTTGSFTSVGTLASASNGFNGPVDIALTTVSSSGTTDKVAYHGMLGGAFFGPAAQELGATFAAPATTYTASRDPGLAIGAVLGHH